MSTGCTGPCKQGRIKCPTPADCQLPEPKREPLSVYGLVGVVMIFVSSAALSVCGLWHLVSAILDGAP